MRCSTATAWSFPDELTRQVLWRTAYEPKNPPLLEGNRFKDYYAVFVGNNGLARREPGAEIFFKRQVEGDVYPTRTDLSINRLEPGGELPAEMKAKERLDYSAVEVQPELRGFAFCDASVVSIDNMPKWPNQYRWANRINGEQISEALGKHANYDIAFERDEFILFLRTYEFANSFAAL